MLCVEKHLRDYLNLNDEGQKGDAFDIHVHYPNKLYNLHNGYALTPDNQAIKTDMLKNDNKKDIMKQILKNSLHP